MSCDKCGGTGKTRYTILPSNPDPVDIGDGIVVQDMGGVGTRACVCVRDLPAIDGKAKWWETESIYSKVVVVPIGDEAVEVSADCEVPRADDGRRVHRTWENAYYPPLVEMQAPEHVTLHSDTARELAAALVAAADACDARDAEMGPQPVVEVSSDDVPF